MEVRGPPPFTILDCFGLAARGHVSFLRWDRWRREQTGGNGIWKAMLPPVYPSPFAEGSSQCSFCRFALALDSARCSSASSLSTPRRPTWSVGVVVGSGPHFIPLPSRPCHSLARGHSLTDRRMDACRYSVLVHTAPTSPTKKSTARSFAAAVRLSFSHTAGVSSGVPAS